jgi:hypothetical protein
MTKKNMVFYDGKIHVRSKMCDTCIFRPGNLMSLREGRVEQMIEDSGDDGCIPCHDMLDCKKQAVCRGFWKKHKNQILQIAERLGFVEFVK